MKTLSTRYRTTHVAGQAEVEERRSQRCGDKNRRERSPTSGSENLGKYRTRNDAQDRHENIGESKAGDDPGQPSPRHRECRFRGGVDVWLRAERIVANG